VQNVGHTAPASSPAGLPTLPQQARLNALSNVGSLPSAAHFQTRSKQSASNAMTTIVLRPMALPPAAAPEGKSRSGGLLGP
jgi:hypothetical protein